MKYSCFLLLVLLFTNCSKHATGKIINCESLQQGLINDDVALIDQSLSSYLNITYSEKNLNGLADTILKVVM